MAFVESAIVFATDPLKMLIVTCSIILGLLSLMFWKNYDKPVLLYTHLLFILSPIFYFALSINCSLSLVNGLLSWCTMLFTKFTIYILPPLMAFSFIAGCVLIPRMYKRASSRIDSKLLKKLCALTGISAGLFVLDRANPVAFSTGKNVFVSVGMFELLSKKEIEAVLLHELHHVRSRSSWSKFSARFVNAFSPVLWFSVFSVEKEEVAADEFASNVQGTSRFLKSAKRKVSR